MHVLVRMLMCAVHATRVWSANECNELSYISLRGSLQTHSFDINIKFISFRFAVFFSLTSPFRPLFGFDFGCFGFYSINKPGAVGDI